jgi:hypothetical protein
MIDQPSETSGRLCRSHLLVLAAGFLAGLVAAFFVSGIPFNFSADIIEAKRLGIVSKTILAGYAKKRDIVNYAAVVLLPVAGALGSWLFWSRGRRAELASLLAPVPEGEPQFPKKRLYALLILLGALLLTFNINNFYAPSGGWGFLGEEGQFLADVQVLLGGGDYARDFFCLYGPLVVYPLAWAMKLFGATILVGRFYSYLLVLLSALIITVTVYHLIRNRGVFVLSLSVMLLTFVSGGGRTNATMLRVFLGLLPLILLYRYGSRRVGSLLAGVALGVSLMFSQEVGLCALLASVVFLFFEARSGSGYLEQGLRGALLALGCSLVVLPVIGYFYRVGALGRFMESLYGYPKLVTLGYGSLPFPSFRDWLSAPFSGAYFPYWIIAIYLVCAVILLVRLFLGLGDREVNLRSALLVLGLLLFRAALGRSDESHYFFAAPPAFLLAFALLDDAVGKRYRCLAFKDGKRMAAIALLASLLVLFAVSRVLRENALNLVTELATFPSKFVVQQAGVSVPQLPRGGVQYDQATADDLKKIVGVLDRYTNPGEPVLFFPNEAAYYFLFNRPVPTRYVHAYFAVSSAQRREMVAELERSRPRYVIYTLDNWRIDDITEDIQVPEVVRYLKERYVLAEDLGNMLILRRTGDGGTR